MKHKRSGLIFYLAGGFYLLLAFIIIIFKIFESNSNYAQLLAGLTTICFALIMIGYLSFAILLLFSRFLRRKVSKLAAFIAMAYLYIIEFVFSYSKSEVIPNKSEQLVVVVWAIFAVSVSIFLFWNQNMNRLSDRKRENDNLTEVDGTLAKLEKELEELSFKQRKNDYIRNNTLPGTVILANSLVLSVASLLYFTTDEHNYIIEIALKYSLYISLTTAFLVLYIIVDSLVNKLNIDISDDNVSDNYHFLLEDKINLLRKFNKVYEQSHKIYNFMKDEKDFDDHLLEEIEVMHEAIGNDVKKFDEQIETIKCKCKEFKRNKSLYKKKLNKK